MPIPYTIAIDGPVAAGKTVVGRLLARRLGYRFVDTGAMYRAATWAALEAGVDFNDEQGVSQLVAGLDIQVGDTESVWVNGRDVTAHLRQPQVERGVSLVARLRRVREVLVQKQRELAQQGGMVMVGRDIGTHVLHEAGLKVFLVASRAERARRRHQELHEQGSTVTYQRVLRDLEQRDRLDTKRQVSPLRPAEDARTVKTQGMSVDQVVEHIMSLVEGR